MKEKSTDLLMQKAFTVAVGLMLIVLLLCGEQLVLADDHASILLPASGFALAILLRFGLRHLPAIAAAYLFVELLLGDSDAVVSITQVAVGILQPLAIWAWMRKGFGFDGTIKRFRDLAALWGGTACITAISALVLEGSHHGLPHSDDLSLMAWLNAWASAALGIYLVTPLVLVWTTKPLPNPIRMTRSNALVSVLLCLVATLCLYDPSLITGTPTEIAYLTVPIALWLSVRVSFRTLATLIAGIAAVSIVGSISELGPFAHEPNGEELWELQIFLGITLISASSMSLVLAERDAAKRSMQRSDERFRAFVTHTREPFWCYECDPPLDTSLPPETQLKRLANTRLVEANDEFARDHGYQSASEIIGVKLWDFISDTRKATAEPLLMKFIQSSYSIQDAESHEKLANGEERWYLSSAHGVVRDGFLHEVWGTSRVITERKMEALRFQRMLQHSFEGIAICDRDEVIIDVSPSSNTLLGFDPMDTIGMTAKDFIVPEDYALHRKVWDDVVAHPGKTERYQARISHLSGQQRWLEIHLTNMLDDAAVKGIVANYNDITEFKLAEDEARNLEAQVQHAQKLESLGVLAGGIAHDFNNLLTAILGNAELAIRRVQSDEKALRNLTRVQDASKRAAALCSQMLAYSGRGSFIVESLDLSLLIKNMLELMDVSISKKAELRLNLAENLPVIEGDVSQINQVILNLLTNANEALGSSPGTITISTSAAHKTSADFADSYLNDELPDGQYITLKVEDTGSGMTPNTRLKIFDPFFSTKFAGRGLGMAAVLGIVRGHKGAIFVESEQGKGSAFTVCFPAQEVFKEAHVRNSQAATVDREDKPKGALGRVLLVDDEVTVRETCGEMLESLGYQVEYAHDGVHAIEVFTRERGDFRCVLLDLTMPRMAGDECFEKLMELDPSVRVVIASGYASDAIDERFQNRFPFAFIAKPYTRKELASTLERVFTTTGKIIRKPPSKSD